MRAIILLVLLAGCTAHIPIDYDNKPPSDWPVLREEIVYGTPQQVQGWCAKLPEASRGKVSGCALAYFELNLCRIFLTEYNAEYLEHERMHCKGYVHVGEGDRAHQVMTKWRAKSK